MGGLIIFAAISVPYLVLSDRDAAEPRGLRGRDRLRRDRLRRRLHQDRQAPLAGALGALEAARSSSCSRSASGTSPTTRSGSTRAIELRISDAEHRHRPDSVYLSSSSSSSPAPPTRVNLTDGLDGLAAGCCAIVLLAYTAITFVTNGQDDLSLLSACLVGACVGFLWFNSFPASIFMGDTGSLGLGGAIGALAVMTQTEVLLIIIGGIFVIEALSVAIQVAAFKLFRRRVLLMAPLHHHFELMAWSETKIMLRFWIIAAVCAGSASRSTSSRSATLDHASIRQAAAGAEGDSRATCDGRLPAARLIQAGAHARRRIWGL